MLAGGLTPKEALRERLRSANGIGGTVTPFKRWKLTLTIVSWGGNLTSNVTNQSPFSQFKIDSLTTSGRSSWGQWPV